MCSSSSMMDEYRHRPEDFRRRILSRVTTSREDLVAEENRWLARIRPEKFRGRYHNVVGPMSPHRRREPRPLSVDPTINRLVVRPWPWDPDHHHCAGQQVSRGFGSLFYRTPRTALVPDGVRPPWEEDWYVDLEGTTADTKLEPYWYATRVAVSMLQALERCLQAFERHRVLILNRLKPD